MFASEQYVSSALMARITQTRVKDPEYSSRVASDRARRHHLTESGKLNLLAADHPARNVTKVGDDGLAMADRREYLARILRVLSSERVDGIMATMDILEDLLTIDGFLREADRPSLLDHKLLIGSVNRGGLAGTAWEIDDPTTGVTPATCHEWGLDGAKFLMRVDDSDAASLKTIMAAVQAINECNALRLPMFLEPLPVTKTDTGYAVAKNAKALAKLSGVASALGTSSKYLWLKLPYCENYGIVARSTTLPILLLGGESAGDPAPFLRQLESAMAAGPNVRGALVGRNVLFPGSEDPLAMAEAAGGIVHRGWTTEQAMAAMAEHRGRGLERFQGLDA